MKSHKVFAWAALVASICLAQTAYAVVELTCEVVAVPDGNCNSKSVGSTTLVPSETGSILCERITAVCSRDLGGGVCEEEDCEVYVPQTSISIHFSGWRVGPPNAGSSCNTICGGTGGPTGCNAAATSALVGLQSTVNLLNILGVYDSLFNGAGKSFISISNNKPGHVYRDSSLTIIKYRSALAFTAGCGVLVDNQLALCCCSSDSSICTVPSSAIYNVPWPS